MILTNDITAVKWLKLARYEGRDISVPYSEMPEPTMLGWNMYMYPEQAATGLILLDDVPYDNADCGSSTDYLDISSYRVWSTKC